MAKCVHVPHFHWKREITETQAARAHLQKTNLPRLSIWKDKHHPTEVIYPLKPPSWLVDNGILLNLLPIRVLMCVIKYITMFQLENTGAIHHFNWYPPRATRVFRQCSQNDPCLQRGDVREECVHRSHSPTSPCVCLCMLPLYISGVVNYETFENRRMATHYKPHISQDTISLVFFIEWLRAQGWKCSAPLAYCSCNHT